MFLKFKISEQCLVAYHYSEDNEAIMVLSGRVLFPVWNDGKYDHPGEGVISLN